MNTTRLRDHRRAEINTEPEAWLQPGKCVSDPAAKLEKFLILLESKTASNVSLLRGKIPHAAKIFRGSRHSVSEPAKIAVFRGEGSLIAYSATTRLGRGKRRYASSFISRH